MAKAVGGFSDKLDAAAMRRHAGSAAGLMRSLANPHRLMVLCALSEGEMSVGGLNRRVPLSQSALSQHLAVLRKEGLVRTRREAQKDVKGNFTQGQQVLLGHGSAFQALNQFAIFR